MIEIVDVSKSYGLTAALSGVSLTVRPGSVLGVLGRNGAGKTTLLSLVAGSRTADAGEVRVCGVDVARSPYVARDHVGYAPQEVAVYPTLTVRRNLAFFARIRGVHRSNLAAAIEDAAAALGLGDLLDRRVGSLSGGECRRGHVAVALLGRPDVLLLDEASAGLDIEGREQLLSAVRRAVDGGAAVCYSTHHPTEIESLGGDVAILEQGKLVAQGTVEAIIAAHANELVELRFDGVPPEVHLPEGRVILRQRGQGSTVVVVEHPDAGAATAEAVRRYTADGLASIRVVGGSLESAYLSITSQIGTSNLVA